MKRLLAALYGTEGCDVGWTESLSDPQGGFSARL